MTKPLSQDLRSRVVAAIDGGLSRRQAAARFGVAASTAVKWAQRWRASGTCRSRPQGGDRRSGRIEAHAKEILALVARKVDITLVEIGAHLAARHGERFVPHDLALPRPSRSDPQKKQRTPASRTGPTSPRGARRGATRSQRLIRGASSLSTKPGRRRRWPGSTAGRRAAAGAWRTFRMVTGRRRRSSAACAVPA